MEIDPTRMENEISSSNTIFREKRQRRLITVVRILIIGGLLFAVYQLRIARLETNPPGLFYDEGANGMDALDVLHGHYALFFSRNTGREGLIMYAIAALIPWLGQTITALRLPAALASAGTVFALFWLGNVLFTPENRPSSNSTNQSIKEIEQWRGIFIGCIAAGLLAVSINPTILGRISFRANFVPFFLTVGLALFVNGLKRTNHLQIIIAGVITGLLAYTYIAARVVPIFLLIWVGIFWLHQRKHFKNWQNYTHLVLVYAVVTAVVALPMIGDYIMHPEHFFSRSGDVSVFSPTVNQGAPLATLTENVVAHLSAIVLHGDPNWRHNDASKPLLTACEAVLFCIGLLIALYQHRHPRYTLLLCWFALLMLPAVLAKDSTPPNSLRMIGAFPAIYLLTGLGAWGVIEQLIRAFRWVNERIQVGFVAVILLVILVIIFIKGKNTYYDYFDVWSKRPEVYEAYRGEWVSLASQINQVKADSGIAYVIPLGIEFGKGYQEYEFDYLSHGLVPTHIVQAADNNIAEQLQADLLQDAATSSLKQVKIVDWSYGRHWNADATERLSFLLSKYGRFVATEQFTNYDVHSFEAIDLTLPWHLTNKIDERLIRFDGGITLLWSAIGGAKGQQFEVKNPISVKAGTNLWNILAWRGEREIKSDYRFSLRLRDEQGQDRMQSDYSIVGLDGFATTHWVPGAISESLVLFQLPNDLPKGDYKLILIVYDEKTLTPTVQEGIWLPEIELASFQLDANDAQEVR